MILEGMPPLSILGYSIFAYDPGETSGWAWCCIGRKELTSGVPLHELLPFLAADTQGYLLEDRRFMCGEIKCFPGDRAEDKGAEELYYRAISLDHMAGRVSRGRVGRTHVVGEGFTLRELTKDPSLLSPVRLYSKVELLFYRSNEIDVWVTERQQASDAKATCTDARMRSWGLWLPGKPHATDATRHLIVYLRRLRQLMQ